MEALLALEVASASNSGRRPMRDEVRLLIRRMASENILWGQRRIQAELTWLGFKVSARTVAKHCACRTTEDHRPAGDAFSNGTLLRSAPVTSSASRLYGSRPFLRPDFMVQDPLWLLRGQPRQSRSTACPGD